MMRFIRLAAPVLAALPLFVFATPTLAESIDSPSAEDAAEAIQEVSDLPITEDPVVTTSDGVTIAGDIVSVEVPTNPSDGVVITTIGGDEVGLGLPGASQADNGVVSENGTVVYEDALPSTTVAMQVLDGGAVRALIVVDGADAPTEFRFPVSVPDGGGIALNPDGSAEVWNEIGMTVAVVEAPWAKDARGAAVSTRFRLEGTSLVQVVDHRVGGLSYPVVADPSLQFDCGFVTCTLRFNRQWTRNVRDGSWVAAAFLGICTVATAGVGALVCAVVAARLVVDAVVAGRYYENGNCIKYKISFPPSASPQELKRGTYNCA